MNPQHLPDTGKTPNELIKSVNQQIAECKEVLEASLYKCTIVVQGRKGREAVNKVFTFPPGSIPIKELRNFFQSYMDRLQLQGIVLTSNIVFIRVGNDVVSMDAFIKEYTGGIFHSLTDSDIDKLRAIQAGESCEIKINNTPLAVQRIN